MHSAILQALREGTAAAHARLDATLPLTADNLDPATYVAILGTFQSIQSEADRCLAPFAGAVAGFGYDITSRREVEWLDEDLAWWRDRGALIAKETACSLPRPETAADAMGWVYVLEGSTLGGQVILRHVVKSLGLEPPHGCRYFMSHGDRVGDRWRNTCQALANAATSCNNDHMVRGARELFEEIEMTFNHVLA